MKHTLHLLLPFCCCPIAAAFAAHSALSLAAFALSHAGSFQV